MFSAGDFLGAPGTELVTLNDPGIGIYKKLVIADGRLVGVVLFGDTGDGLWYLDLIRSGAPIEAIRDDLVFGRALAERKVVAEHGKRSPEDAARYVAELKKNDRYQADVY